MSTRTEGGVAYDIVRVWPSRAVPTDIWINHDTHLIFRFDHASGRSLVNMTDYRKVSGVMVPFTSFGDGFTVRTETASFEAAGAVSFSLPPGPVGTEQVGPDRSKSQ
jgi:hypothetical protein